MIEIIKPQGIMKWEWRIIAEPKTPVGQYQEYQHMHNGSFGKEKKKGRKNIWKYSGKNIFGKINKSTYPWNSMDSKKEKLKDIHTEIDCNHIDKDKNEQWILKAAREEWLIMSK